MERHSTTLNIFGLLRLIHGWEVFCKVVTLRFLSLRGELIGLISITPFHR